MPENKNNRDVTNKLLTKEGVVVSDKMDKTIVVRIDRDVRHSFYRKVQERSVKIKAHDEKNIAKVGDVVKIVQTRPLSREKRWRLDTVVRKGPEVKE